eukprot:5324830-Pleurochrysis_carterae.AAC.4
MCALAKGGDGQWSVGAGGCGREGTREPRAAHRRALAAISPPSRTCRCRRARWRVCTRRPSLALAKLAVNVSCVCVREGHLAGRVSREGKAKASKEGSPLHILASRLLRSSVHCQRIEKEEPSR